MDIGTSGGVHGLDRGYCLMIGGDKEAFDRLEPIFKALAPGKGEIEPTKHRDGRDTQASRVISIAARSAPAISSRWFITASNMA